MAIEAASTRAPPLHRLVWEGGALCLAYLSPLLPVAESLQIEGGSPVLVLPGFLSSDSTTSRLRRSLSHAGFKAYPWLQGGNIGFREGLLETCASRLEQVAEESGEQVILLGWSLGGLYAREVAKLRPELVRCVISLGSPFSGDARANNAWRVYELLSGHKVDDLPNGVELSSKPGVPTIAIWSSVDGIVSPESARGLQGEADQNFEIKSLHMGMGVTKSAIRAIVDVLATVRRNADQI